MSGTITLDVNDTGVYTLNELKEKIQTYVAHIIKRPSANNKRVFNTLKGKCTLEFADDYKMTDEELVSF